MTESNSNTNSNLSNNDNSNTSSSNWWGFVGNTWNSIKETAKDFSESITEENKDTIDRVKETVNQEQITDGVNKVNNFIHDAYSKITSQDPEGTLLKEREINETNKIIQSYGTTDPNILIVKPKRFEKERITYASNPLENKKYTSKYTIFLENLLKNTTEDELCLNGRALMQGNHAILMYFKQLVPHEVDEITFWKRYYFWKYRNELRQKILNKNLKNDKNNGNDIIDVHIEETEPFIDEKINLVQSKPNSNKNTNENNNNNSNKNKIETKNNDNPEKEIKNENNDMSIKTNETIDTKNVKINSNLNQIKIERKLSNESDIVQTINDTDDTNDTENVEDDQDDSNQSKTKSVTSESWQNITYTKSVENQKNIKDDSNKELDSGSSVQNTSQKVKFKGNDNNESKSSNDVVDKTKNDNIDDPIEDDGVWGWE